jgi:hypothetical protein
MKRIAVITAVGISVVALAVPAAAGTAIPGWLPAANQLVLDRVFGGARPLQTHYISYPHKIAVVFVFSHVVVCGACSAPSNADLPRGRVIRFTYDRRTHRGTGALEFCEAKGTLPPRALCLRR